jgi:hypothetical protein
LRSGVPDPSKDGISANDGSAICGGVRGLWNLHLRHQLFHLLLSFGPRAIVEIVERVDKLWPGIETLVL